MGLRSWFKRRMKEVVVEELERKAQDLQKGKPMNTNIKATLEAVAFFALSTFFGALAGALSDGTLSKPEVMSALGAAVGAIAAYFKKPAQ